MKPYKVILSAHGNIDHDEDPFEEILPGRTALADTIEECRKIVREFIDTTDIGAGNWTGGEVYDTTTNEQIGYISYNSRYWSMEEWIKF